MVTWQLFSDLFIHIHCLGVRATDGFYPQRCPVLSQAQGVTRERPWPVCPFVCPVSAVSDPRWQHIARQVSGPCWFSRVRNIADNFCWMAPALLSAPAGLSLNPGCSLRLLNCSARKLKVTPEANHHKHMQISLTTANEMVIDGAQYQSKSCFALNLIFTHLQPWYRIPADAWEDKYLKFIWAYINLWITFCCLSFIN